LALLGYGNRSQRIGLKALPANYQAPPFRAALINAWRIG
jgi:hypothetical protein